ncbi:MAG: glutamyl-tRNA amidotransferase [Magnetovibrio sp.]|nr:glutamyl-tRNA amidotransferase [Magnetovibrio sp.]|tara:strand:+ start:54 stop:506 length:453 start_codon:yes stop_codon:yes gene_type:complete
MRAMLSNAFKSAMKDKETVAVSTLRLILAAIKDRDIAARTKGNTEGISDDEILALLQSMIKQRRESIDAFEKGGRMELVKQETSEIAVIERFLPRQMSEDEMTEALNSIIVEVNASTLKDMGKVMGALKERFPGRMDFSKVSGLVKKKLN